MSITYPTNQSSQAGNTITDSIDPRLLANAIRFLTIDAIERVGEGHPGTPLGSADVRVTAVASRKIWRTLRESI